jgi:hypothetical protein
MINKSLIFSISTRCENELHTQLPINCVKSILNFYPDAEIVIVDSCSPNKTHIPVLKDLGCIISDLDNVNYEAGAMWDTFSKFDRDYYIFLQDSMVLLGNIDEFINNEVTSVGNLIPNWEGCEPFHIEWVRDNINKSEYYFLETGFNILQYNSMIVSKNILNKFKSKNLDKILPINKIGSCGMERIFGISLQLEGYPINENSLLPKHLIQKTWTHRQ